MPNEYNSDNKIILRDTAGNQMSLPRFFQLALVDGDNYARPTNARSGHYAWDMGTAGALTVPARTPVCGTITSASDGWNGGMGTHAIVTEDSGREHRFMHFVEGSLKVSVGDTVQQGDQLGTIGNTGESQGAHLHYDVRVDGKKINDPMDAYDTSTLPSGWNFADAVDNGNNWDYIPLDKTATDYGPPDGETASEPFFTDKFCYDISTHQSSSEVSELISDTGTGGFIIRAGVTGSSADDKAASYLSACKSANMAVGFYFACYTSKDSEGSWESLRSVFETCFGWLTDIGATPETTQLGVWLDMESGFTDSFSEANADNLETVRLFQEVGNAAGYPVCGLYTNLEAGLKAHFDKHGGVENFPFWYSRPGASRATVDAELQDWGFTKAYLWQDGYPADVNTDGRIDPGEGYWSSDKNYTHKNVDNDTVLQEIPTAGSGEGGGGGGGTTTQVVDVTIEVVPPKRIYFSPVPGVIKTESTILSERNAKIELSTDADNAELFYTIDGSSPYQYVHDTDSTSYTVAANAISYTEPIIIYKDTHIRVVAVPSGTGVSAFDEPLAKGSGTYLFEYNSLAQSWEAEQRSYASSDDNTSFFEENRQAFLRLHDIRTTEEVLYAATYKHDTQSQVDNATDRASGAEGGDPTEDKMG